MTDIFYAGMIPFYLTSCYTWTEGFDGIVLFGWEENTGLRTIDISNAGISTIAINNTSSAGTSLCATTESPAVGMGVAVRIDPTPPDLSSEFGQFIEITVADLFQMGGNPDNFRSEIQIFNFGARPDTNNPGGNFGYMRWESDVQNLRLIAWSQLSDGSFTDASPEVDYTPWGGSMGDVTLRLESYRSGRTILYLNGTSVIDYIETTILDAGAGFHQGITMWWDVQFNACAATSPRITFAQGGELCVEAACSTGSLIYRIDSEPADGDIIPNLGSVLNADMVVQDLGGGTVVIQGSASVAPVCDASLPWTALIRIGDFASAYAAMTGPTDNGSISGGFAVPGGAQSVLWEHGQAVADVPVPPETGLIISALLYGLAQYGYIPTFTPFSDIVFMVSANPPAVGGMTSDYRVVSIQGGVVSDIAASPVLYSPGSSVVGTITHTRVPFMQGINGLAMWREYITTDAEFLTKLAEFLAA